MKYSKKKVDACFAELRDCVEREVCQRAEKILKDNPELDEFVKGMGSWFFTYKNGDVVYTYVPKESHYEAKFKPVDELIEEWDDILGLTGDPVRFTADGPEITEW